LQEFQYFDSKKWIETKCVTYKFFDSGWVERRKKKKQTEKSIGDAAKSRELIGL
jgi:hypothetical protein